MAKTLIVICQEASYEIHTGERIRLQAMRFTLEKG